MVKMKIMGLDAAFANVGIALGTYDLNSGALEVEELRLSKTVADKAGKKVVRKNSDDLRRAKESVAAIREAIADHGVQIVFCEIPSGAQSARAAWALGIAVGIIAGIEQPLIQLTPKEVKDVTGERYPDKSHMIAWATNKYPDINWPRTGKGAIVAGRAEHLADAVATIHAGIKTEEFQRTVAMARSMSGVRADSTFMG